MRHKLRTGGHLIAWLVWGNGTAAFRAFASGPRAGLSEVIRAASRLLAGAWAIVSRRGKFRVARLVHLCRAAGVDRAVLCRNPEIAFVVAEELNGDQQFDELVALVTPLLTDDSQSAKLFGIRGLGLLGLGRYREALADLDRSAQLCPALARDFKYNLYRAYLYGIRGETEAARDAMAVQMVGPAYTGTPGTALAAYLAEKLRPYLEPLKLKGTTGVVIGCFNAAVGHAILDPFHFIQLFRSRFDNLILVHPPYEQYSPATRVSAIVLDQYVDQIETTDLDTLNFAWQSLGELEHENLTFLTHHYWSLNRLAHRARTDMRHPMSRRREYLTMPVKLAARAKRICRRNGVDPSRPIVVVHTREHGYHGLHGQRYRNTDVRNYVPALRRLVELGYLVIRIGDGKMTRVGAEVPGLLELPAADYYDPVLDPYFIARCRFMISCQSGPCSYARAFGKPNLVINAVYHYTLLPERNELLAFKQYRESEFKRPMSVEQIFRAGAHLFDRTEHFEEAGIEVEDMTPDEILAATEEMVGWLAVPDRPETAAQRRFRAMMRRFAARPDRLHPLAHPTTDYIGYSLPECRISDAVCGLRQGYLPATSDELDLAVGAA